jgi:phosphatidylserine/phosphatidylglycerophosphate/cardiolipin synthase-like enzyme
VDEPLRKAIVEAARTLPRSQLRALAQGLGGCAGVEEAERRSAAWGLLPPGRGALASVVAAWRAVPEAWGRELCGALLAAAAAVDAERAEAAVELVWTGPSTLGVPVRLTSQVLEEVIDAASQRLLLLTFAAYRVRRVVDRLRAAAQGGVRIDLVLETAQASGGRLSHDAAASFAALEGVRLWHWPTDRRPVLDQGSATLHAKAAVADDHLAFVTSANLTGHALSENIELGVLLRGGPEPARVRRHVEGLMAAGVLERLDG